MKKILFLSALIGFGTAKADLIITCGVSSSDGTREAIFGEKSIIGNCTVVRMDLTSIPTSLYETANESFVYPLISESPAQVKFMSCSNYNYLSVNYKNKLYSRKFKIGDETSISFGKEIKTNNGIISDLTNFSCSENRLKNL